MTLYPLQPGLSAFERCPLKKLFSRRKCSGTIGQYPKWHSEKPYSSEDTAATGVAVSGRRSFAPSQDRDQAVQNPVLPVQGCAK